MIDKIIAGYLSNNKRLVIPEFGAFIRKDGGELVFVEFLKKDDQVLTSLLGREYELSETEAREAIEDYILTVKRTVGQTGKYVIAGVGTVHTDANGLYALDYNPSARKEAVTVHHATVGEQFTEPEMEVINARGHMPTVGEDMTMEHREKTIIFPTREDTIAGLSTGEKTAPREIDFRYREVAEMPAPTKRTTLNDLYTTPAAGSRESGVHHGEQRPVGQSRVETQRPPQPMGRPHVESQPHRQAVPPRPDQSRPVQHPEPQRSARAEGPARQRPVNYSSTPKKKKLDLIMILAVLAAMIALGSLVYGIFVHRNTSAEITPTNPQIENVAAEPPVAE